MNTMAFAVIRIKGTAQAGRKVTETFDQLHLCKINHLVLLPENDSVKGMLQKVKDYATWGEVSAELIAKTLLKRGEPLGSSPGIDDEYIKENSSKFSSIFSFAKAIQKNEARLSDIEGLQPVIRLNPPRSGYRNIKKPYRVGGSLGYRGKTIEKLLDRMIPADADPGDQDGSKDK